MKKPMQYTAENVVICASTNPSEPKSTPLNQFDFVLDTFSEHIRPPFYKIVPDEFKPVFQCGQK